MKDSFVRGAPANDPDSPLLQDLVLTRCAQRAERLEREAQERLEKGVTEAGPPAVHVVDAAASRTAEDSIECSIGARGASIDSCGPRTRVSYDSLRENSQKEHTGSDSAGAGGNSDSNSMPYFMRALGGLGNKPPQPPQG